VVSSHRLFSMTGGTVRIECGFPRLELGRHRTAHDRLCRLRGVAGHEEAER